MAEEERVAKKSVLTILVTSQSGVLVVEAM